MPHAVALRKIPFDEVARRELPTLYRVARRLTLDPTDAEDLVATTLLSAARAWEAFDGAYPRSWLLRILRNGFLQTKRAGQVETVERDPDLVGEEPWGAIDWGLVGPHLVTHLDRLPEEYRLAVALCDIEELSYDEAAAAMEVAVGTVRSRLFRGRRLLRTSLDGFLESGR